MTDRQTQADRRARRAETLKQTDQVKRAPTHTREPRPPAPDAFSDGATFCTCQQAADYIGVEIRAIRRWITEGRLKATKGMANTAWQITKEDLYMAYCDGYERGHSTPTPAQEARRQEARRLFPDVGPMSDNEDLRTYRK